MTHFLTFSFSGGHTGFIRLAADAGAGDDGVCCGDADAFASISMKIERDCLPRPNELMTWVKEKLQQYSAILHFAHFQFTELFQVICCVLFISLPLPLFLSWLLPPFGSLGQMVCGYMCFFFLYRIPLNLSYSFLYDPCIICKNEITHHAQIQRYHQSDLNGCVRL